MRTNRTALIRHILSERILILDGAMGTMLQSYHPEEADFRGSEFAHHSVPLKGNNDVLGLTRPDLPRNVHRLYLEAGADIIETNTFNTNAVSQAEYRLEAYVYRLAKAGAENARAEADAFTERTPDKPRFVAGSVGPTSRTLSMSPDVSNPGFRDLTFDDMVAAYRPAIEGLMDGGADLLLFETIFDTLNAKAACYAASEVFEQRGERIPVMFSGTVSDASGRLLAGQNVEAFLISVCHAPELLSVGFNCALGAAEMRPHIEELSAKAPCLVSAHPNAGLPDESGHYTQTPEEMASIVGGLARCGHLNIVGGCCGTNPDYIRAIAEAVKGVPPRRVPRIAPKLRLAGLDAVSVSDSLPFLNIGERANVAGSKKFLNLMKAKDYAQGLRICRTQVENGAQVLDVNMDDAMLDSEDVMRTFLLNLASDPDIARVPVMIDSSRWNVLRTGLACMQGKCIVNSLSLKEGEEPFLEKAREARRFGAAILAMAFDEQGQADTVERRVSVCRRMYKLLTEQAHVPPEDIIFDPNVFAVATGMPEHDSCALDFIEAVRLIKQEMPLCGVSGGLSNVSFSFRGNEPVRRALHSVFLYHAVRAGLGMAIVNPAQLDIYDDIEPELRAAAEAVILNTSPDASEKLLAIAAGLKSEPAPGSGTLPAWRSGSVEERLAAALVRGDDAFLEADLAEAMKSRPKAVSLIEGPLMEGMRTAGRLFGEGKMFLPQVVKTARTMKRAVDILTPFLEGENAGSCAGTVVLATVKGDVHDIGKNIVSVILRCNSFKVVDLGVMTPCEKILAAAVAEHADAVALSGLITPSLAEMEHVAKEMQAHGMRIPLFIGGATTSPEHTALHIQPNYSGPCVHTKDASEIIPAISAVLDPAQKNAFLKEMNAKYESIRAAHGGPVPAKETKTNKKCVTPAPAPETTAVRTVSATVPELLEFFDWNMFYHIWNVKGAKPETEDVKKSIRADAERMIEKIVKLRLLTPKAVFGIFPADAKNDTVTVYADKLRRTVAETIRFPRNASGACLADFLAESGDWLGMFAVTVSGAEAYASQCDEYDAFQIRILAECLAEAFAEKLHLAMRKKDWGYAPDEMLSRSELFDAKQSGIRAAPGYPACPDHTLKRPLFRLLDAEKATGIRLTEHAMMEPNASICAYVFAWKESFYFTAD